MGYNACVTIIGSGKYGLDSLQNDIRALFPGIAICLAKDGKTGLELAEEHQARLVLLEWEQSDLEGLEVCRRFKENPRTQSIPVLFLTTAADGEDRLELALKAGAEGFFRLDAQKAEKQALIRSMFKIAGIEDAERKLTDALFDSVPGLLYLYDGTGKLVRWNKKHETLTGYSGDELSRMGLMDWYKDDAESQNAVTEGLRQTVTNGFGDAVAMLQKKDGQTIPMYFTASPLEIDGQTYFTGIGIDITEMRRTSSILEAEKERLAVTLRSIGDGVITTDMNGSVMMLNQVAETLTGWMQVEAEGRSLAEVFNIVNETTGVTCENPVAKVLRTGAIVELANHTILIARDGRRIHLADSAAPIIDNSGQILGVVLVFRDVTDKILSERSLKEKEDIYRTLLECAPDAFFQGNSSGNFITVNDKTTELTGYSREELLNMNMKDLFPPEVIRKEPLRYDLLKEGATIKRVRTLLKKNGETMQVEMNSRAMPDGTYQSFVRDITERLQAEEAIRMSEARLRRAELASGSGNWELHLDTRKIVASAGAAELYGIAQDQFDYDFIRSIPLAEYRPIMDKAMADLIGNKTAYDLDFKIKKHDSGEIRDIHSTAVFDQDKNVVFGIIQDVTEFRKAEADKEKLKGQLAQAQKMESVGRLAGGVAHDYNNMLSVIIGYTELALSSVAESDTVHGDLVEILAAAKRSADITRQLLAFARKQNIAPEILDLNETVDGMLKMLRWLIGEDIKLIWSPGTKEALVKVDPSQLDQILANLCVNARDAIAGVGTVTIETGLTVLSEADCAGHEGYQSGDYVVLAVSDDGCGMSQDILDKLFEPFFTTKDIGQGTGLGLATVYGIVHQNSGFIDVSSAPGKGSAFRIFLPRFTGQLRANRDTDDSGGPTGKGELILLVEDERALLQMGKTMLEKSGYRVLGADRASEALRLAEEYAGTIDLVMTDVVMPEMNGRELAERLQVLYPGLKRLFMSGYTAKAIASRGILEDGVDFIQKPFSRRDLAVRVRQALDGADSAPGSE